MSTCVGVKGTEMVAGNRVQMKSFANFFKEEEFLESLLTPFQVGG